jgi:hypothetical protein
VKWKWKWRRRRNAPYLGLRERKIGRKNKEEEEARRSRA